MSVTASLQRASPHVDITDVIVPAREDVFSPGESKHKLPIATRVWEVRFMIWTFN